MQQVFVYYHNTGLFDRAEDIRDIPNIDHPSGAGAGLVIFKLAPAEKGHSLPSLDRQRAVFISQQHDPFGGCFAGDRGVSCQIGVVLKSFGHIQRSL